MEYVKAGIVPPLVTLAELAVIASAAGLTV
jgi:hypothetical protein